MGYGATNLFEGAPAPGLSNTTSDNRDSTGTDTDNNSADFVVGTPNPQNSGAEPPPPPTPGEFRIHDLQGAAHISPMLGQHVDGVPGVVTAKRNNGFWYQDPNPDADPGTSE